MRTRPGNHVVPFSFERNAMQQYQNSGNKVGDAAAEAHEVEKPPLFRVPSVLNPEQEGNDGQFPKTDPVQYRNMT